MNKYIIQALGQNLQVCVRFRSRRRPTGEARRPTGPRRTRRIPRPRNRGSGPARGTPRNPRTLEPSRRCRRRPTRSCRTCRRPAGWPPSSWPTETTVATTAQPRRTHKRRTTTTTTITCTSAAWRLRVHTDWRPVRRRQWRRRLKPNTWHRHPPWPLAVPATAAVRKPSSSPPAEPRPGVHYPHRRGRSIMGAHGLLLPNNIIIITIITQNRNTLTPLFVAHGPRQSRTTIPSTSGVRARRATVFDGVQSQRLGCAKNIL